MRRGVGGRDGGAMTTTPTDRELLDLHVGGDAEAFGALVARHQDRLWRVALRTSVSRDEAADALQDALVRAFRAAGSFRGESAVTTWLHRIVVNTCLDRRRSAYARHVVPADDLGALSEATRAARDTTAGVPDVLDLEAALGTLPVAQRQALVMVHALGYSVDETAAALGVAPGTVKSRCARGRAALAGILGERDHALAA